MTDIKVGQCVILTSEASQSLFGRSSTIAIIYRIEKTGRPYPFRVHTGDRNNTSLLKRNEVEPISIKLGRLLI